MRSISSRSPAVARRASASIAGALLSTKRPDASNCCIVIVNVRAGLRTHIKVVGLCSSVKATKRDIELYFFINARGKVDFGQDWQRFARLRFYLRRSVIKRPSGGEVRGKRRCPRPIGV